eukprot:392372-Alexandrium_andersonii.AAC.1
MNLYSRAVQLQTSLSQCRSALCARAAPVAVAPQLGSRAYAPVDTATCTNAAPTSAGRAPRAPPAAARRRPSIPRTWSPA